MTAMMADGTDTPSMTEHHHYLLPANPEGKFVPQYDGYGRYKLPDPKTGRLSSYTRATTVAKTLDDTYNLTQWAKRNVLAGLVSDADLAVEAASLVNSGKASKGDLDRINERAEIAAGAAEAREFGTAVHAWAEAVDRGALLSAQVPDMYRDYVENYLAMLTRHALVALPEYTERIVLDSKNKIVGTIDRIFLGANGRLILGDVKTSKSLEFGYLTYGIQLAVYHGADYMLSEDGTRWDPMPDLEPDYAILAHVPSDNPDGAAAVTFDMHVGKIGLDLAMKVRQLRTSSKKSIPNVHAMPIPTAEYARQQQAVFAIRTCPLTGTLTYMSAVWEAFQDVWNDDLQQLAMSVVAALSAPESD